MRFFHLNFFNKVIQIAIEYLRKLVLPMLSKSEKILMSLNSK